MPPKLSIVIDSFESMKWELAILWFRNDLRVHDHEPMHRALQNARKILPIYIIDPGYWEKDDWGQPRTGAHRTKFLLESLQELRKELRNLGGELMVVQGKAEEVLPQIADQYQAQAVFAHKEVTCQEIQTENRLEKLLFKKGLAFELYWGSTLYHIEDLPTPVQYLPDVFTVFRKEIEGQTRIRPLFPNPSRITVPSLMRPTAIPSLEEMGFAEPRYDRRGVLRFEGGEKAGRSRLDEYFWGKDLLKVYKNTRNGLIGADYSSKFSPWLAMGNISPRWIYTEVQRYEESRKRNESTYWLVFELIWRDFFRFVAKKYGEKIFLSGGIQGKNVQGGDDPFMYEAWKRGETGIPFIDANMRELNATGFMSNRGRQNVASFFVHDLQLDWRMGAAYFESQLIDYDVCSNWGNWNYVAGVGNDPRKDRYFNVLSQANTYDPKGQYVKLWLPELEALSSIQVHAPWEDVRQTALAGITLGKDYPHPIINLPAQKLKAY